MNSKKTSVHFVNSDGNGNKVIIIPTFVLLYWKRFLFLFGMIMTISLVMLSFFIYQKTSEHYKSELDRANYIKTQIDLQKLKKSFETIDKSIYRVNQFMEKRGLQTFKMENVGGMGGFENEDINEVSEFYVDYINSLEKAITSVPMGLPHEGKITSHYGTRQNPFTGYGAETHSGIDFKGNIGEPIQSTANGKVIKAGKFGGYGNCVVIQHEYQLETLYAHLSKVKVKVGDQVEIGDTIGLLGSTGRSTGPHLHYEIHYKGKRINPNLYLNFN